MRHIISSTMLHVCAAFCVCVWGGGGGGGKGGGGGRTMGGVVGQLQLVEENDGVVAGALLQAGRNRKRCTSATTTAFMPGCSASTLPSRYPAAAPSPPLLTPRGHHASITRAYP